MSKQEEVRANTCRNREYEVGKKKNRGWINRYKERNRRLANKKREQTISGEMRKSISGHGRSEIVKALVRLEVDYLVFGERKLGKKGGERQENKLYL